jgi:hypothetical protein
MGFSLAWIAVRGIPRDELVKRLGVEISSKRAGYAEVPISLRATSSEWELVISRNCDEPLFAAPRLASISKGAEAVACVAEEHVMFSSSQGWVDGHSEWSVEHDAQERIGHLQVVGTPPAQFERIRAELEEQQQIEGGEEADVDFIFDIPLVLARELVGFKHDEVIGSATGDGTFVVLGKKAWWRFGA